MTQAWSRGEAISRQHIWTGRDRQSELSDEAKELSNVTPRLRRGGRISSRSPAHASLVHSLRPARPSVSQSPIQTRIRLHRRQGRA